MKGNSHVLVEVLSRNLVEVTKDNYENFGLVSEPTEIQIVASRQQPVQAMYV